MSARIKDRCLFIGCIAIVVIVLSGFMYYFIKASPKKFIDTICETKDIFYEKSELIKDYSIVKDKDSNPAKYKQFTDNKTNEYKSQHKYDWRNNSRYNNPEKYGYYLEFYIEQSIGFYQHIITLLLGVIGFIIVISFIYLNFTSKLKAEEMAHDALNSNSFQIILTDKVKKEIAETRKADNYDAVFSQITELIERVDEIDKRLSAKDDDVIAGENAKGGD
jgi:uncharacterized protein (UPF0333 family)